MKKQKRLGEILRISLNVFAEYGYKKTTVEDIAVRLDITKSALYVYIKDKKELYEKAVASALVDWQNRVMEEVMKEKKVEDQFITMCYKALQYLSEDNDLRRVLANDPDIFPIFPTQDRYSEINETSMNFLSSILQKGIDQGRFRNVDIDSVTKIMFYIYKMFIVETYVVSSTDTGSKIFDQLIRLVTDGLFNTPDVPAL